VGVGGFCRTYRYTRDGSIITDIEIDLTGLDSSGTENDVIGLESGAPAAYLGRNVVSTNGIIYKVEVTCLEVPLTGDADILFVAGSDANEAFDLTVANTQTIADGTGDWTLGETIVLTAPAAIAANYYYYMTQGATDNNKYTAGQFLLRFYGKAVMSA
jgi:ABC-type molybdate transport system substrate-binding protein